MTCFWDGIMNSLGNDDRELLGLRDRSIYSLIDILKNKNCKTTNLKWQGKVLSNNEINQNIEHIKNYNKNIAPNGYLCSTCDPFLALLSYILNKVIVFNYCGHKIEFEPINSKPQRYYYRCNTGHFWFHSKK